MKRRLHPLLIVGIVCGLIAFIATFALLDHPTPKTEVVVAAAALPARTVLSSSDLRVTSVPTSVVPPDALSPYKPVVGDVLAAPVWPGEILLDEQVQQGGAQAALSAVLAPGDRAFAVEANVAQALAGQIAPGDKVDVVAVTKSTGSSSDSAQSEQAVTIVQHVVVLAISASSGAVTKPTNAPVVAKQPGAVSIVGSSSPSTSTQAPAPAIYTLALTPEQVQEVALAETLGKLYLSLDPNNPTTFASVPSNAVVGGTNVGPVVHLDPTASGKGGAK